MEPLNLSFMLVMSLKRLLIGSISLSEDSQPDEENEEEHSERPSSEMDSCQSTGRLLFCLFLKEQFDILENIVSCREMDENVDTTVTCKLNIKLETAGRQFSLA